ncbi:MAG TPA: helix-turn-helix domain-containing protein [Sulfurimonas sp.]|uniref:helix-turn-helix domain-containing protein n=1 Tax=Sulfurimonas sp. TaxID=2022749 RepID=UPI002B56B01D|nr:helix-turn-helix domain-containing protein [Sulfurimonas sp.]HUH43428.1 helix-turn-helix domain-containing protein [Sulfurimonas sp.]
MTKQYYTTEEVAKGIEDLPPISKNTLRSLRTQRKIRYSKIGITCVYKKEWIEDYLNGNIVEVAS